RVENWMNVRRRLADDAQNVAGRGLFVECHGQLAIARLKFLEQPHILDGDDRLVGERFQQRDLAVRKEPGLRARYNDDADGCAISQQWDVDAAAMAYCARKASKAILRVDFDVWDLHDCTLENCPARPAGPAGARRPDTTDFGERVGTEVVLR